MPGLPGRLAAAQLGRHQRCRTRPTSLTGTGQADLSAEPRNRFERLRNYAVVRQAEPRRGRRRSRWTRTRRNTTSSTIVAGARGTRCSADRLFADTKLSYNNTHFPLYQKTDQQSILDNSTGVRLRNRGQPAIMFRRRLQFTSNWNYYLPQFLGGRHEFKFGFDNSLHAGRRDDDARRTTST